MPMALTHVAAAPWNLQLIVAKGLKIQSCYLERQRSHGKGWICMCRAQTKGAQDGAACSSSDAGAPLLHKETVEQSLEDGLTEVRDFQGLLATRPKQVIKWLQENGMEKLGEFEVQVRVLMQALCSFH